MNLRLVSLPCIILALLFSFTLTAQPVISGFTPASGPVGTLVTISGSNLAGPTALSIGGVPALSISNTGSSLVAMVMPGAATGVVSVTTAGGSTSSGSNFTLAASQLPNGQQGNKLTGSGPIGAAQQGWSVAVSADGNTAIVGGYGDNSYAGAAWVYIRNNGVWTQQGTKLIGTGAVGAARQGYSVSVSADGNTAILGAPNDNASAGAAWIFVRNGSTWTQQGNKLVGTGTVGTSSRQGYSVSMSADGNTVISGGYGDNTLLGAAWVFVRSGSTWTQQGSKLVGTGTVGSPRQGWSVALSADGKTAIVGGYQDNASNGAAWIFSRSGSTWTQQGNKLVGTGNTGAALQGSSVALNADGNTAVVGGIADNNLAGAAWVFTRSGSSWLQQGTKLVGTGAVGAAQQGASVSVSADGNTLLMGGIADNNSTGASWKFTRSGTTWLQQGNKLAGTGATGNAQQGSSVALSADGNTALIGGFSDNTNTGAAWVFTYKAPPVISGFTPASGQVGTLVTISGTGFDNPTGMNIGGIPAILISSSSTSIVAMVMPGAATGAVTINTQVGSASAAVNFLLAASPSPNAQQGAKLVDTTATIARQGCAVAVSADGNTAIVGGYSDNGNAGAAWVYTRSNGVWTKANKLVASGAIGAARQGFAVAISADGSTAMVGGPNDNNGAGAAWIFTRIGNAWMQQGSKLVGTSGSAGAQQGYSVAISADGNTAILGGYLDNNNAGALWVFTRTGGIWAQQGNKLVGSSAAGSARQGYSVALSADGNTAISGGPFDASSKGALWVFVRSNNAWAQQGSKLSSVASNHGISVSVSANGNTVAASGSFLYASMATVYARTGTTWAIQADALTINGALPTLLYRGSVAISADGNRMLWGEFSDNNNQGSGWIFNRNGDTWTQSADKLLGIGTTGNAEQGGAVALSADGSTALLGGIAENIATGAAWVFTNLQSALPVINQFTPASGRAGTLVTITGYNLSNLASVSIGGVPALALGNTGTSMVAMVMPGAITGEVAGSFTGGVTTAPGNFTVTTIPPPNTQQGSKLVGTGGIGASGQGYSVALSADGTTAIVGGAYDNASAAGNVGAVWIYVRNGNNWTQQGSKLVPPLGITMAQLGFSVAISADGNTAIAGAPTYNNYTGSAWVFKRTGGAWEQQGNPLVGAGALGQSLQGTSVALSADGNTALVGARGDSVGKGAVWVFTRSAGTWKQSGNKLVGTGAVANSGIGTAVAISADGNTAIVGGRSENILVETAWVFTRSGNSWQQMGNKLTGTGAGSYPSISVGMSADGQTAIVGGPSFSGNNGAAWIFTRNGGSWVQQGSQLAGSFAEGNSRQGYSVGISADGNMAIIGGPDDNNLVGAAWTFTRAGDTWTQQGIKLVGTNAASAASQGFSVALSADGSTVMLGGVSDSSRTGAAWAFQYSYIPPPSITSFTPQSGPAGTLVTITGTNLNNPASLLIGGVPAIPVSNTGTSLVAMVMPGAGGPVSIITPGGSTTGAGNYSFSTVGPPGTQQGNKLVGTGATGAAKQGYSVAISADGNTAIVGGYADNNLDGAAWIFTRTGDTWTQQGTRLVGTGLGYEQGFSVGISADGNTAIIGAPWDNNVGAAYIFVRNGSNWVQQGNKLVGTEPVADAQQGYSVAISADGNTAIVGTPFDVNVNGAVWVYRRTGTTWRQMGNKISGGGGGGLGRSVAISADGNAFVIGIPNSYGGGAAGALRLVGGQWQIESLTGTGAAGGAQQGYSVAISADGNTILSGGIEDNKGVGAVWVFTRSGNTWKQQGTKLTGWDATAFARFGGAVSLSADGNTAVIGGFFDNNGAGAGWLFTRTDSTWTQQGNKLSGSDTSGKGWQGNSVAISADGKTVLMGGPNDQSNTGAAWVFVNTGPIYTFVGYGNWDVPANWTNNKVPPAILPDNAQIIINPLPLTECVLNVPVTLPPSASLTVAPGKKFRIQGNLTLVK